MASPMNTVNVIEMTGDTNILSLKSWEDNENGNKAAEAHFLNCMMENEHPDPDGQPTAEACLEDGLYECGDYKLFLIHSTGTQRGKLPTECPPVIHAECHSDDHNIEISFDASPWFNQASDTDIINVVKAGWSNDYPLDEIAFYFADFNERFADLFKYIQIIRKDPLKKDISGFECSVDEDDAIAWLKANRSLLYQQLVEKGTINA